MPSQLFTLARSFKAAANGKIYIGQIDTDPVNPANQIQVYLENEDGSYVPVAQPLIINAGGYPVYNGQIAKFVTVQGHSMAVYDAYGTQQFYFPNILKYDPDQFRQELLLDGPPTLVNDSRVAVKAPYTGTIDTSQHDVNNRVVSIIDFGGYPDGVNHTENAISKIKSDPTLGAGTTINFPRVGDQSTYYFSNTYDPSVTSGLIFDCETGVRFSLPDIAFIDDTVTFTRDTPSTLWALGNCKFTYPGTSKKNSQSRPIWHISPDASSLYPINPSLTGSQAQLEYTQFDQRNDTQTAFAPSSTSTDGFVLTNSDPYIGQYGLARIGAGEDLSVLFSATTGSTSAYSGMVVTGNSRYWFTCGVTNTGQVFVVSKINGSSLAVSALAYEGQTTHDSYRLALSSVTLRKDSDRHFSLLINGYSIWETDTTAPIVKVGFGATGGSGSITVSKWVHRSNSSIDKGKFISGVSIFGDSITDENNYGAWPGVMQGILDSNYGVRVANVYNYAVSGATSSAQLPFVNATNLAKSNLALILLGVNDIQAAVGVSEYISNINTMIDTCRDNANTPVIGMPTMFYSRGQTNPPCGQDTTNYSAGAPYRSAVMRLCAEKNVKFVDLGPVLGPVLGNWNNITLGIPFGDSIAFDVIHPTPNARYLIARAFAGALLGIYVTDRDDSYGGMLPESGLLNSWTMSSIPVGYASDSLGRVSFYGSFNQPTTSPVPDGTVIYSLPENLRPRTDSWLSVANEFTNCRVFIGADGGVKVYGMTGGLLLAMDGVVLHTRHNFVSQ